MLDGFAIDVWALGVTLFTMLTAELPFQSTSVLDLAAEIRRPVTYPVTSPSLRSLLKRMLDVNPATRIRLPDIAAHPWTCAEGSRPLMLPLFAKLGLKQSSQELLRRPSFLPQTRTTALSRPSLPGGAPSPVIVAVVPSEEESVVGAGAGAGASPGASPGGRPAPGGDDGVPVLVSPSHAIAPDAVEAEWVVPPPAGAPPAAQCTAGARLVQVRHEARSAEPQRASDDNFFGVRAPQRPRSDRVVALRGVKRSSSGSALVEHVRRLQARQFNLLIRGNL